MHTRNDSVVRLTVDSFNIAAVSLYMTSSFYILESLYVFVGEVKELPIPTDDGIEVLNPIL